MVPGVQDPMIRTGSITSAGRTGTSPRLSSTGAEPPTVLEVPTPFGPIWPGLAVAAELSMGVDARPEGPLTSSGHVTKGKLCREQASVFGAVTHTIKPPSHQPSGSHSSATAKFR